MKFYTIHNSELNNDALRCTVNLENAHPVFKGHFPGQPIVPGVLLVQMVRELLTHELGRKHDLIEASSVKFLNAVDPNTVQQLLVNIDLKRMDDGVLSINAAATNQEVTYFKLRAKFKDVG